MQRLGLTLLAFTLVIGVIGCASASQTQDEAAVRALGDNFAKAFVQKNADRPSSQLRSRLGRFRSGACGAETLALTSSQSTWSGAVTPALTWCSPDNIREGVFSIEQLPPFVPTYLHAPG